ncbi:MAG: hypothetical protein ACJA1L_001799 [Paracoccaceae bacterium]|jgi:hypothetical protein
MVLTGLGLTWLFQRQIEQRVGQDLDAHLKQIIGDLRFDPDGSVALSHPLSDPRFGKVFGGLHFQVTTERGEVLLKSRSLWDTVPDLPRDALAKGMMHVHHSPGPNGAQRLMRERRVLFADISHEPTLRITVGIDTQEISALRIGFAGNLVPAPGALVRGSDQPRAAADGCAARSGGGGAVGAGGAARRRDPARSAAAGV